MRRRRVLAALAAAPALTAGGARASRLAPCGPVRSSADGQVLENLDIQASAGDALTVSHSGVVVRNCRIRHATGHGVAAKGAAGLQLRDIEVVRDKQRGLPAEAWNNVHLSRCPGSILANIRAAHGSSNIYIEYSPNCQARWLELHDASGPYPRGQNFQLNQSPGSILEDFSGENGPGSWTEDNVSIFCSDDCTIRRGLVSYNNSPTGDGVMLEGSSACLVMDVDAVAQGNGAFAAVPAEDRGSGGCTFLRCRTRDSYASVRDGRDAPESRSLSFYMAISPGARKHVIADCHYDHLANAGNLIWDARSVARGWSITARPFTARAPVRLRFAWSG